MSSTVHVSMDQTMRVSNSIFGVIILILGPFVIFAGVTMKPLNS